MSRRSGRNRHRQPGGQVAVKARTPPGTISLTGDQLTAIMAAGQNLPTVATPLPRPPNWATDPFNPGQPLRPAPVNRTRPGTGRAEPRLFELPISTNISWDNVHVPWRILREAADIPLFRKCIEARKEVCKLDFAVVVDPAAVAREAAATGQTKNDIESALRDKYAGDIARITDWVACPDRQNKQDWDKWASLLMDNRLTFDASVVYPRMTYGGQCDAWRIIDGSTIKPLMDSDGAIPAPPAPAYQQILYGFPRSEFTATTVTMDGPDGQPVKVTPGLTADQLMYERTILRSKTPYGMSATEMALLEGIVWMRRFGWIMAEYTEGVMPDSFVKVDGATDWTITQWEDWSRALNDHLGGNTQERMKFQLFPPGTEPVQAAMAPERYKPDYDLFLIKLVAGNFNIPASELNFVEAGALGASFHEGEEDILYRRARLPDAKWLGGIATKLAIQTLGMPRALKVTILGLESEDEAANDAVASDRIARGVMSRNEDRARIGLPPLQFEEADMMTVDVGRGVVFLDGASKLGPPGTLITPPQAPPQGAPPQQDVGMGGDQAGQDDEEEPQQRGKPGQKQPPVSKAAERQALRRWLAKGRTSRPFECTVLTAADVPDLAADPRVVLKAGDPGPKARASSGTGPAGRGTWT